ncbi:hypothetical protein M0802_005136 [Mischocyttarus mexicanus]|nr:hypothetical protein M0802_005136 [Mischocyttarus mexicanus]
MKWLAMDLDHKVIVCFMGEYFFQMNGEFSNNCTIYGYRVTHKLFDTSSYNNLGNILGSYYRLLALKLISFDDKITYLL